MAERAQVERAVSALVKYSETKKQGKTPNLLDDDDIAIQLVVTLKKIPEQRRTKPYPIWVPNSLYLGDGAEVCIFTKDPQKEYRQIIAKLDMPEIAKVIGISKLRSNYKPFEAKRKLSDSYTAFLSDDRILPLLPKLLGKSFFTKKRQPIPIKFTRKDVKKQIVDALNCTYMHIREGVTCTIRVASTKMTQTQMVDNIMATIEGVAAVVPRNAKNFQALHIKTPDSVALPLYSSAPDEATALDVDHSAPTKDKAAPVKDNSPAKQKSPAKKSPFKKSPVKTRAGRKPAAKG